MIQVVVLAGGEGTRLKAVTGASPKVLACANGRPLLDLQLTHFAACGVKEVLVLTGYRADEIAAFCGDGSAWRLSVRCVRESEARGTGGALFRAKSLLAPEFVVTYGDTVFDFDLARMVSTHRAGPQVGTLLLHPNDHPHDSDLVEVDMMDRVVALHPYPHADAALLPNLVNAGVYVLSRDILDSFDGLPERPDFGKHVFPHLLRAGEFLYGYRSPEYVKDAGTPKRLAQVSRDLASGRVAAKSLRVPAYAVFLDRDGTINLEKERIADPDDLELYPRAAAAIARLNDSTYRTVVATNQAVVARGDCSEERLRVIHNRLEALLGAERAYVDRIYYCPHIPDRGFPGENIELKIRCDCRKPEIGMLTRATRELNLDLSGSWMIGDSTGDVETARRAGLISILLSTGHGGGDGKWPSQPDAECLDLFDAVTLILDRWPGMLETLRPLASRIVPGDIVLLGGQARAGKSQHAAALRRCLEAAGKPATVISLDAWLRAENERNGESVLDRYDLASAAEFLRLATRSGGRFLLPRYDRRSRRPVIDALELQIPQGAVLVVEGVPALASTMLTALAQHRIALRRSEEQRRAAMRRDYASRGWSPPSIEQLIEQRLDDEFPVIQASMANAEITLDNGRES
jgi:histidinol-phosphate phosphatase family protein